MFPRNMVQRLSSSSIKKGNALDSGNYRPITVRNHLTTLFTSVINARLMKWSTENDTLTDSQFGFRPRYGTSDAIFVLHTFIQRYLHNKKKSFIAVSWIIKKL